MNLEDLVDEHLAGKNPEVPESLRKEFDYAVAGHAALQEALTDAATLSSSGPSERPPPTLPDDYEMVRELGHGGMGVVYLVRQKSLGRQVAVKVLRPGQASFGRIVQRFLEEARHLARLRHANIVSIHEIGRAGGEPYFTMDYVEGESLSALLARERLSPSRALAILKQSAEAVEHAHAQGIIHRDLKPGNILIDSHGRAYVTDFGLARDIIQRSKLTHPGEVMGTPAYMAPEQAEGKSTLIGEATDVYGLGALLYEMLTGQPPFGNDAPIDVLLRLLQKEPAPPRKIDRRIPRDLETICLKALAKAPERRYATVHTLLEDIRRFEAGLPIQARRPGMIYRGLRLLRRHWKMATAVAVTAAIMAVIASFIFGPSADELIAGGDERHAAGKHAEAARLYRRALWSPSDYTRAITLERLIRCYGETDDNQRAIDAALQMLDYDPHAWFGEYDYAVAQAVLSRGRTIKANTFFGITKDISSPELALTRFQMFLNGPYGSEADRHGAEEALAEVRKTLGNVPAGFLGIPDGPMQTPSETPLQLLQIAKDTRKPLMERASSAFAVGTALERSGDSSAALSAYRQAYELLKAHFPAYSGVTFGLEMSHPRSLRLEPRECSLLRHIVHSIRRLDPAAKDPLRGGLRFRVTGLDLPPDLAVQLSLHLWDAKAQDSDRGLAEIEGRMMPGYLGTVPLQLNQTAWVGVADGRYRLVVRSSSKGSRSSLNYGGRANMLNNRLELDFSRLPKEDQEIEVRGSTVDLPVIVARLRE